MSMVKKRSNRQLIILPNNSSRPVDVSITNFVQTNNESIADISALTLTSPTATTDETLISNGTLINFGSPIHLFTLANKEGKLTTDGLTNYPSATTFWIWWHIDFEFGVEKFSSLYDDVTIGCLFVDGTLKNHKKRAIQKAYCSFFSPISQT